VAFGAGTVAAMTAFAAAAGYVGGVMHAHSSAHRAMTAAAAVAAIGIGSVWLLS
jgi:hypothetical protein